MYFFGHHNKCNIALQFRVITIYNFLQYVLQIRHFISNETYAIVKVYNLSKNGLHIFY